MIYVEFFRDVIFIYTIDMGTKEEYLEDFGIDYTKLWVMSAICIGTIIGNVAVILAIVARNIKVIYEHDYFNSATGFNFN